MNDCSIFAALLACLLGLSSASTSAQAPGAAKPASAEAWRAATRADLEAAARHLRENSPIPFDRENAHAADWLETGLRRALTLAEKVESEMDWYQVLSFYGNGFRDPHVRVLPLGDLPAARWPGFTVSAQGENAVVATRDESDADLPLPGTVISRCDGKSMRELTEERVFPYVYYPALPADYRRAVTSLFVDRPNILVPAITRCTVGNGAEAREHVLRWRAVPAERDQWMARLRSAAAGPATTFGVSEPVPGVTWIGVPTFSSGEQTAPQLEALIRAVTERGDAMRDGRAIVIDTRGNGGGNSAWSDRLAAAIFTPRVLARHQAPASDAAVDWRASRGNAAFWRAWAERMKSEFGADNERRALQQAQRMEANAEAAVPLFREGPANPGRSGGLSGQRPRGDSPFPARVYFLSNGSCASSCLNFADKVLFVPGVKLIGLATSGDGMLMEVRNETLPSGLARVVIPQKVARGRGRGALEVYQPDATYDGPWDDASVRQWVLRLIGKEAPTR